MKKFATLFVALFATITIYAQGIAVQGIARDNTKAAIPKTNLEFTFSIINVSDVVYKEKENITTDNFGVFSHIVGTGTAEGKSFSEIDFSISNLKIKIEVKYKGSDLDIYEKEFQYTPYAHYAKRALHGVPTGTIIAYADNNAPKGWLLCDGNGIPAGKEYDALRSMIGNNTPNLKGRFLRGAGNSGNSNMEEVGLRSMQDDMLKDHMHTVPGHVARLERSNELTNSYNNNRNSEYSGMVFYKQEGSSKHLVNEGHQGSNRTDEHHPYEYISYDKYQITIPEKNTKNTSGKNETRPYNYGVNYIIKL